MLEGTVKTLESENHSPLQPPQAHPECGLCTKRWTKNVIIGDDDNSMFTMHSLPTFVSWLGSHTESMIAAMADVCRIDRLLPDVGLSVPTKRHCIRRLNSASCRIQWLSTSEIPVVVDLQHSFRNSDVRYHDPEKCEHAGLMVTTLHGGNSTTRMIKRFTMADDLKESSKITQVKGTKFKDHNIMYKEINA
ncbi:hypothetical protein Tco_0836451 [Tanacetum coccineum]